jgi:isoamylase
MRNSLATLLTSQGVPMLLHGDEIARTQHGNNNAYCQDSQLTWQPWDLTREQRDMLEWTRRLIRLRKTHGVLRRRNYFCGRPIRAEGTTDILWLRPDGQEMSEAQWLDQSVRALGVYLAGDAADVTDEEGRPIVGDSLMLLLNSSDRSVDFRLPADPRGRPWRLVLDTARPRRSDITRRVLSDGTYRVEPRSMAILRLGRLSEGRSQQASFS